MSHQQLEKRLSEQPRQCDEVVVATPDYIFSVDVEHVMPTRALDAHKNRTNTGLTRPMQLCPHLHTALGGTGTCPRRWRCTNIHLSEKAAKFKQMRRLRTPCCWQHGDTLCERPSGSIKVQGPGTAWRVKTGNLALTNHPCPADVPLLFKDVCIHHLGRICKFGRDCERVHICRVWAKKVGLTDALLAWEIGGSSSGSLGSAGCSGGSMPDMDSDTEEIPELVDEACPAHGTMLQVVPVMPVPTCFVPPACVPLAAVRQVPQQAIRVLHVNGPPQLQPQLHMLQPAAAGLSIVPAGCTVLAAPQWQ